MTLLKYKSLLGEKGLTHLEKKTVTIVGIGSVGSVVAEILTRMKLSLRLVDKGRVEEEDLATGAMYTPEEITRFKAKEAKKLLERMYPQAKVKTFHEELTDKNAFLIDADVVVDCTNNLEAMELVNKRCKAAKATSITAAYAGSEFIVICSKGGYNLTKWQTHVTKLGTVKEKGLLGALSHVAGGLIAAEVLNLLLGKPLLKKPYKYDVRSGSKKEFSL